MASSLNCCMFIGNLGRDVDMRHLASGTGVANFSIGVGYSWKDKNSGERQDKTEWVHCVAFGSLADICGKYLANGSKVFVRGRMQTRQWEDKEGNKRYSTEIILDEMQMLDSKQSGQSQPSRPAQQRQQTQEPPPDFEDDIPF